MDEFGGAIRPTHRRAIHFAQHGIHEWRGGALVRAFDQFHAFGHGGVGGNAVQIAQLENAHAQGDANFEIELRLRTPREMGDQEIELALITQASEDQSFGERGIAGIERGGFLAQEIGGVAAGVNFNEDAKGNCSSGGNGIHGMGSA